MVKLLPFGGEVEWEHVKLFEREAQILRQLNHPQIPQYRDYFCIDDRMLWFVLVQQYIAGASLKDRLAQGVRLNESEIRRVAIAVMQVLIYLHELNPPVLHRDIKPGNLIWGHDQQIYVVDFGAVQDRATREGASFTVVGTYGYTPIEQFGGRAVPASDLYAVGATLIHLLTGISPADLPQKQLRIQFSDRVTVSPALIRWIETLTHPDPTQRFQNARQALAALQSPPQVNVAQPLASAATTPWSLSATIDVQRSDTCLSITLHGVAPQGGWSQHGAITVLFPVGFMAFWLLMVILKAGSFGFIIPLAVISWIVWMVVAERFQTTHVTLDLHQFAIRKELFGLTMSRMVGQVAQIEDVFHSLKIFREGRSSYEARVVTIQTRDTEFSFGKNLTRDDCVKLVREIKQWLGMAQ